MDICIETDRLVLKPVRLKYAGQILKYRRDEQTNQYQGWIPKNIANVKDFIKTRTSRVADIPNTWYQVVIFKKVSKELIGDIGIHFLGTDNLQVELGFTLSKEFQGKGYATEAVRAVIQYLFQNLDKHRIIASIDPRNEPSIRLAERLKFRKEAHFRKSILSDNEWCNDLVYGLLKKDWENTSAIL